MRAGKEPPLTPLHSLSLPKERSKKSQPACLSWPMHGRQGRSYEQNTFPEVLTPDFIFFTGLF